MTTVVVGGGFAGLFVASELTSRGVSEVVVVDKSPLPGGVARTVRRDGFALEPAAGSFSLPHPHLSPILERVGVAVEAARSAQRYVYIGGNLVEAATSPRMLLSPILPITAKLRALGEPVVRTRADVEDESLAAFCERRFGDRAGKLVASLMASGVFAGDPLALSARSAFPGLAGLESEHGSVVRGGLARMRARSTKRPSVHVPVGGMDAFADALAGSLEGGFRGGFDVKSVRREKDHWVVEGPESIEADAVVLAVSPAVAAGLLQNDIVEHLGRASAAPVAVVGLGGTSDGPLLPGFGALVGPDEGMVSRGVLFESAYATSRAPEGSWLMKVIAGGAGRAGVVDWDDNRIATSVCDEVSRVLGAPVDAEFTTVIRHRPGIPQYGLGHSRWLADVDVYLGRLAGLHVTGWGYRGVGVSHVASDAVRVATAVEKSLR